MPLAGLGQVARGAIPAEALKKTRGRIENLGDARRQTPAILRRLGYGAWIAADGSGDAAFLAASKSKESLRDLLAAVPSIADDKLRGSLYSAVRSLMFELPPNLKAEAGSGALLQSGIQVDYFHPNPPNVAVETLAKLKPQASGIVPQIVMNVPQRKEQDAFALRLPPG